MITLPYGIIPTIYTRGASGVPSSRIEWVNPELLAWEHSISDSGGFESASLTMAGDTDAAITALNTYLMCSVIVSSPDAETIWDGVCVGIECDFGTERRALSLDGMGNAVIVTYTDPNGAPATATAVTAASSIATYGRKEKVLSFDRTNATDATQKATRALAQISQPVMQRSSGVDVSSRSRDRYGATIRLRFVGWYYLLDWLVTSNTATSTAATSTQIASLIASYVATNAFFSSSSASIVATGVNAPQTIANNTTYRKAIEDRANSGNSSGFALAWGFYESRLFTLEVSAESTPNTVDYRRNLRNARIYDTWGSAIPWWNIRPNNIYEVADLLDPVITVSTPDTAGRHYIARTQLSLTPDQITLTLEGRQGNQIDKLLARIRT